MTSVIGVVLNLSIGCIILSGTNGQFWFTYSVFIKMFAIGTMVVAALGIVEIAIICRKLAKYNRQPTSGAA